jgi:hypothetical protein
MARHVLATESRLYVDAAARSPREASVAQTSAAARAPARTATARAHGMGGARHGLLTSWPPCSKIACESAT